MKLKQIAEGIQARTQRWRQEDFDEEIELFTELAPDLEPGGREYIGELHLKRDFVGFELG